MENRKNLSPSNVSKSIECAKCHKQVSPENGQEKNGKFICNDCIAKSKRNKFIALAVLLACCVGGGLTWYFLANPNQKLTATGFDGVTGINDSVNIQVDSINVEFNLATAAISSTPVSTQAPISNIEEFKRVVAKNIDAASSGSANSLEIPVSAVLFGFKSSNLSNEAKDLIKEIATIYNQTSRANSIVIDGYACNIGADAPNDYISKERAEIVKAAFIENGIDPSKISTHWYGKSKNAEFNLPYNEDNRRVLISIR
ncbi:MAG: OmpA family protein [Muribaculaceae bacterium]|nr:OmpA family protein [Muribaculaceae bacterium]